MVVVVGEECVLHYVKREGEMSGWKKCPGNMSKEEMSYTRVYRPI